MRLKYYTKPNFGDALNPIIFNKLLPNFFDDDPKQDFFGIGSIIGLPIVKKAEQKIIFSSGFAYGSLPEIDHSYDVVSVRGPLTAEALNLDNKLAIADGALLLREFQFNEPKKDYEFSFMPHWESENKYPWNQICMEAGIHYVSPTADPLFIIEEIKKSKVVIAEAMHYAIVADTLRVPWIAVKAYPSINDFKWQDWTESLGMEYNPTNLASLYQQSTIKGFLKRRNPINLPEGIYDLVASAGAGYGNLYNKKKAIKGFENAKKGKPQLSAEAIFNSKVDQLLERLLYVEKKYKSS